MRLRNYCCEIRQENDGGTAAFDFFIRDLLSYIAIDVNESRLCMEVQDFGMAK